MTQAARYPQLALLFMIKILFLDFRDVELVRYWQRRLHPPTKHREAPLLVSDSADDGNYMCMHGSVIRRPGDGLFQLWYSAMPPHLQGKTALGYAESDDGIHWRRPLLDRVVVDGRKTNLVFEREVHGPGIYYDPADPRPGFRYKMLCGAAPSGRIAGYRSEDGIHWGKFPVDPVIGTNPDSPISLHRAEDGRFVAYHRRRWGDRRVGRSESWDFQHWSEARIVMEPGPNDPPQMQFYGMGSTVYGNYELATLWVYHTLEEDMDYHKPVGHQEPELAYSRTGYAWHRAAEREPWIRRGRKGAFDWGMIQCTSQAVLMDDEIRYYYAGARVMHPFSRSDPKTPRRCGLGMASTKPDRFVALSAGGKEARLLTRPIWTEHGEFYVNAAVAKQGWVRAEITDIEGKPIAGYRLAECEPVKGDATAHLLRWRAGKPGADLAHREIRVRLTAKRTDLFSIFSGRIDEIGTYWRFRGRSHLDMRREKALL